MHSFRPMSPGTMGGLLFFILFNLTAADTLTAHLMILENGTQAEANPFVVWVWESAGVLGLWAYKTGAILFIGLMLFAQVSRLTLSVAAGAVGLTLWAAAGNYQAYAGLVTPLTVVLFNAVGVMIVGFVFGLVFYNVLYGRFVKQPQF